MVRLCLHHHPRHTGRERYHAGILRPHPSALLHQRRVGRGADLRQVRTQQIPEELWCQRGTEHPRTSWRGGQHRRAAAGEGDRHALLREACQRRQQLRSVKGQERRPAGSCPPTGIHGEQRGDDRELHAGHRGHRGLLQDPREVCCFSCHRGSVKQRVLRLRRQVQRTGTGDHSCTHLQGTHRGTAG